MTLTINLNDWCYAPLTAHGRALWDEWRSVNGGTLTVNDRGEVRMMAWQFAACFGPHLRLGKELVTVNNELKFVVPIRR